MAGIRSFTAVLAEMRDGAVVAQASQALHEALSAVRDQNKPAKVVLTLDIKPMANKGLVEQPINILGTVTVKLPKEPEASLFFIDADGNASRVQTRQQNLGLSISSKEKTA